MSGNRGRGVHSQVAGNCTTNVAPGLGSLSHHTRPFMASTIFLTMDKPRPVACSPPVGLALRRANCRKVFSDRLRSSQGPSSCTSRRTALASFFSRTKMFFPVYLGHHQIEQDQVGQLRAHRSNACAPLVVGMISKPALRNIMSTICKFFITSSSIKTRALAPGSRRLWLMLSPLVAG